MKTSIVMTASAFFLAVLGLFISFLPTEILNFLNIEPNLITVLFLKTLSALYLGFAILNWMAKGTLIGGIYNKPISFGNLMHFGVGAVAFFKIAFDIEQHPEIFISLTVIYVLFTAAYIYIFRTNPAASKE